MPNIKEKSSRKLQGEFQELRKRYLGQHLWANGFLSQLPGR
ncbi:MAG: transposase [Alphaproteobacteria bacterium]|nr:transposase [Alphaproteobacteria bacterium]